MISLRKRSNQNKAGREFAEWASMFCGELFLKISIYADESGTHDPTGDQPGSQFPIIAGYAARRCDWVNFCCKWKAVLDKYRAPYFHSRELRAAKAAVENNKKETRELKKNPYYGWKLKRINDFLIELAKVAAAGKKIPIAGAIRIPAFNRIKAKLEIDNPEKIQLGTDPYKYCMGEFFRVYHKETWLQWGEFKWPVTFFFDQNDNPEWQAALHEVFGAFQKKDSRMKEIVFANKKDAPHLPLQAADMLAYRIRQNAQNLSDNTFELEELDRILLKNLLQSAAKINPELSQFLR